VDPRAGLDDMEKKTFLTLPGLELRPSVAKPVANRYTDCPIPAHECDHSTSIKPHPPPSTFLQIISYSIIRIYKQFDSVVT
jgi:hypothetical protein